MSDGFPCAVQANRETLEVLFLGTGAALPSKYRNVTATYLNLFDKVRTARLASCLSSKLMPQRKCSILHCSASFAAAAFQE